MFTSRAEFRLQLREDNTDMRLSEIGRQIGLVGDQRWDAFNRKRDAVSRETTRLKSTWVHPAILPAADAERLLGKALEREYTLLDLLRRPAVNYDIVSQIDALAHPTDAAVSRASLGQDLGAELADAVIDQLEIAVKYAGYIDKQRDEVERATHFEHLRLPVDLDYAQVTALSIEVRQKLARARPETLGHASRISGVTPAAISLLLVHLKKKRLSGFGLRGLNGGAEADIAGTAGTDAGPDATDAKLGRSALSDSTGSPSLTTPSPTALVADPMDNRLSDAA
jgi:tRNA uridine 5-carboxymethylaminomethyl modification enzyme